MSWSGFKAEEKILQPVRDATFIHMKTNASMTSVAGDPNVANRTNTPILQEITELLYGERRRQHGGRAS